MTLLKIFVIAATLMSIGTMFIWSSKVGINLIIKMIWFVLSFIGCYLLLNNLGQ